LRDGYSGLQAKGRNNIKGDAEKTGGTTAGGEWEGVLKGRRRHQSEAGDGKRRCAAKTQSGGINLLALKGSGITGEARGLKKGEEGEKVFFFNQGRGDGDEMEGIGKIRKGRLTKEGGKRVDPVRSHTPKREGERSDRKGEPTVQKKASKQT